MTVCSKSQDPIECMHVTVLADRDKQSKAASSFVALFVLLLCFLTIWLVAMQ